MKYLLHLGDELIRFPRSWGQRSRWCKSCELDSSWTTDDSWTKT